MKSDFCRLRPLRIAVLAGGYSAERAISLSSGKAVSAALILRGHAVTEIDPVDAPLSEKNLEDNDVVFLALHGQFGEDGQVQAILDRVGIPYTGSDADASRIAFSKSASKERFLHCHVPTLPYVLIHATDEFDLIHRHAQALKYPLFVKPDRQGSSLGVSIVQKPDDLPGAVATCFRFDSFGLLEKAVVGSEWTVGVVDDEPLPLIKVETNRAFFDYEAKYQGDSTQYRFEFQLSAQTVRLIERVAIRACQALNTRGIARVDLRLDADQQPWVLEVNTIPGFTDHSLVPKSASRLGIDLGELCERDIAACLERQRFPQKS